MYTFRYHTYKLHRRAVSRTLDTTAAVSINPINACWPSAAIYCLVIFYDRYSFVFPCVAHARGKQSVMYGRVRVSDTTSPTLGPLRSAVTVARPSQSGQSATAARSRATIFDTPYGTGTHRERAQIHSPTIGFTISISSSTRPG